MENNINNLHTHDLVPSADNVKYEFKKLLNEINGLLEKIDKNDPAHKENAEELTQIKKYLEKTSTTASGTILLKSSHMDEKKSPENTERHNEVRTRTGAQTQPQDIVNMNLDDSILQGIDGLISLYKLVGNPFYIILKKK